MITFSNRRKGSPSLRSPVLFTFRKLLVSSFSSRLFPLGKLCCVLGLQEHQKVLATVYLKYSLLDPVAGKPSFGLEEWKVGYE